ncbi:MAG: toxin-antitoxin system YwqK family antitoxin [Bacteroidetes bacterium]|nr:toxin-antitoxin system YwqK family antitoxin [Bacteroidota bacterium]
MKSLSFSLLFTLSTITSIFAQENSGCFNKKLICPQKYKDCKDLVSFDEETNTYFSRRDYSILFSGTCITCYRNGVLREKITIVDGKRNGQDTSYYNSGCPQSIQNFVLGKLNGTSTVFYDSTGRKEREITHSNNVVNGRYILFENNEKSDTISLENYKNGKQDGIQLEFYENSKRAKVVNYRNGLLHGSHQMFDENGRIELNFFYKNGQKHGKWNIFYPDGKEARVEEWSEGLKNGEFKTYDVFGKIISQASYTKNLPEGKHLENYPDGNPKHVTIYQKGKKVEEYTFDKYGVRTEIIALQSKKKRNKEKNLKESKKKN